MSKELINIISKDDLKTLVNQVYEQRKIYRDKYYVEMCFPLLQSGECSYLFENAVDLRKIKNFNIYAAEPDDCVDNLSLFIKLNIAYCNKEIDIEVYCYDLIYDVSYDKLRIRRTPKSTVEETTNAIIELIEEINNKQSLFELVWSE
ncbi:MULTISPECIES: hypothetical protein [unclassified Campylobacter]|uniref:hypothetical protein n=1 Tax=unclassified Campylobacter TaxID=2593542 RepID=UPI001BDA17AA|nr:MULTISPECIES: hypothetical protein [unclassified Campylobacter]MBZ7982120.1 hypothetical protein [Campylobacter sp. RM12640]MBZ7983535.1 hypothetical protein [Campylobacter sp. RM12647]MBZ7989694.1 hypothetical protein [Campylobacter sp. RM12635]MBZ7991752.1 hypothetical protein [Campylobacter sp. RM9331]MBZ8005194.1 hypothetical protein [Campylobacter sp. RM9332]